MNLKNLFLLLLAFAVLSCNDDDDPGDPIPTKNKYEGGVWVLNEGNFGTPNGTIGYFFPDSNVYVADVYGLENEGIPTGDVLQSLTDSKGTIKIVANNDNKVVIMDHDGQAEQGWASAQFSSPRFLLTSTQNQNEHYVSNWGPFDASFNLVQSFVLKVDNDGQVEKKIETDKGAEGLYMVDGFIYVANSFSNTIEIIDTDIDTVVNSLTVGFGPQSFAYNGDDNRLWVISTGTFGGNDGSIAEINTMSNTVAKTYTLTFNPGRHLSIQYAGDTSACWFYSGKDVYSLKSEGQPVLRISDAVPNGIYALAWNAVTQRLFISDHNNYSGNGKVFIYDTDGTKEHEFEAGILPNAFQ